MAFDSAGFATIAASKAGNAPSVYSYTTTDAITVVRVEGYFNAIASILKVGDLIYCQTSTGGTRAATLTWVNANSGTVVDVTDGTTISATDSD